MGAGGPRAAFHGAMVTYGRLDPHPHQPAGMVLPSCAGAAALEHPVEAGRKPAGGGDGERQETRFQDQRRVLGEEAITKIYYGIHEYPRQLY